MANNIDVTPGTGKTVATTDVGGFQFQNVIIADSAGAEVDFDAPASIMGANGTTIASNANPLPISDAGGSITVDGSVTAVSATAANLNATVVQATAANFNATTVGSGPVAPGTAQAGSILGGGVYTATKPTLTNLQQAAFQFGTKGSLCVQLIAVDGTTSPGIAGVSDAQAINGATYLWTSSQVQIVSAANTTDRQRSAFYGNNAPGTYSASVGLSLWSATDLTQLRINVAASGDTALVAAVASQTTRVYRMRLTAPTAIIVQIKNGATVLEVIDLIPGVPYILELSDRPYYKTSTNTALNINLSAATQVNGMLEYVTSV